MTTDHDAITEEMVIAAPPEQEAGGLHDSDGPVKHSGLGKAELQRCRGGFRLSVASRRSAFARRSLVHSSDRCMRARVGDRQAPRRASVGEDPSHVG
jgi:hypothetical protein